MTKQNFSKLGMVKRVKLGSKTAKKMKKSICNNEKFDPHCGVYLVCYLKENHRGDHKTIPQHTWSRDSNW